MVEKRRAAEGGEEEEEVSFREERGEEVDSNKWTGVSSLIIYLSWVLIHVQVSVV